MTTIAGGVVRRIDDLVGGTPLLQLELPGLPPDTRLVAKLESANPLSSSKDRAALTMLRGAEQRGELVPGGTVVEATSGNTGIALAGLAAARGYRCHILMPDNASTERVLLMRGLGATVELTEARLGLAHSIDRAWELAATLPDSWYARQHLNEDNVRAHYETTGPEIWAGTGGRVDVLVCGVGTGGTLTGAARHLRERNPDLLVVAVQPAAAPMLTGGPGGPHRIPGLLAGFVSPITDLSLLDEVVSVTDEDAAAATREIGASTGLAVGVSSGAAAQGCRQLAGRVDLSGRTVATVFPDGGERYLSWWTTSPEAGR